MVEKHHLHTDTFISVDPFPSEERFDGAKCGLSVSAVLLKLRHTGNSGTWNQKRSHPCDQAHTALSSMGRRRLGPCPNPERFQAKTESRAKRSSIEPLTC